MIAPMLATTGIGSIMDKAKPWADRKLTSMPDVMVSNLADACQRGTIIERGISNACRVMPSRPAEAIEANAYLAEPLTPREVEILQAICEGDSNQDIARKHNIKMPTVKYHVFQIFGKLGVQRRTQAVAVSIYLGLVVPKWLFRGY
jgi:DNA-binding NarL/FixJ family response regulator